MTRAEIARKNFTEGCNCAQAVLLAFLPEDYSREAAFHMAMGLGGGVGRMREVCGTVTGAACALGILFPELSKAEIYALVREHAEAFARKNGSYICRELLKKSGVEDTSPLPEARTPAYYRKRPCADLVADSAAILEEICQKLQDR